MTTIQSILNGHNHIPLYMFSCSRRHFTSFHSKKENTKEKNAISISWQTLRPANLHWVLFFFQQEAVT